MVKAIARCAVVALVCAAALLLLQCYDSHSPEGTPAVPITVTVFELAPDGYGDLLLGLDAIFRRVRRVETFDLERQSELVVPIDNELLGRVEIRPVDGAAFKGNVQVVARAKIGVSHRRSGELVRIAGNVFYYDVLQPEARKAPEHLRVDSGWGVLGPIPVERDGLWAIEFGSVCAIIVRFH